MLLSHTVQAPRLRAVWSAPKDEDLSKLRRFLLGNFTLVCGQLVTDDGLAEISQLKVEHLILDGCTQVTDAGFAHLRSLPLSTLTLMSCSQITDHGISHLSQLPLQHLVINDCESVSDEGLDHLNQLPLRTLAVSDCPLISDHTLPLFGNFRTDYQLACEPPIPSAYWYATTNDNLVWVRQILLHDFTLECSSETTHHGLCNLLQFPFGELICLVVRT
jgi:hypothetical protein